RPSSRSSLFPYTTLFRSVVLARFVSQLPIRTLSGGILMRAKMFLLAGLVAAVPLSAQAPTDPDGTPFFLRKVPPPADALKAYSEDRKSTRLNSSHVKISY